jgi:hypothetical protein
MQSDTALNNDITQENSDPKSSETQSSDTQSSDTQSSDTQSSDTQDSNPLPPSYESLFCVGPSFHNLGGAYDPIGPNTIALIAWTAGNTARRVAAAAAAAPASEAAAVAASYAKIIAEDSYARADRLVAASPDPHSVAGHGFAVAAATVAAANATAAAIATHNAAELK